MEAITRVIAGLVEFCLPDFEHIDLHCAVRGGQQDRRRFNWLGTVSRAEHLKMRHAADQTIDDV